jgi:hypothetical protein
MPKVSHGFRIRNGGTITIQNTGVPKTEKKSRNQCMMISLCDGLNWITAPHKYKVDADVRQVMRGQNNTTSVPSKTTECMIDGQTQYDEALDNFCVYYNIHINVYEMTTNNTISRNVQGYPIRLALDREENKQKFITVLSVLASPGHFECIVYSPLIRLPPISYNDSLHHKFHQWYGTLAYEKQMTEYTLRKTGFSDMSRLDELVDMSMKTCPNWDFLAHILPSCNPYQIAMVLSRITASKESITQQQLFQLTTGLTRMHEFGRMVPEQFKNMVTYIIGMSTMKEVRGTDTFWYSFIDMGNGLQFVNTQSDIAQVLNS